MELAKAWGNVGSAKGLGILDATTAYTIESTKAKSNEPYRFAPFGMDLEAFQRVAIELKNSTGSYEGSKSLVSPINNTLVSCC